MSVYRATVSFAQQVAIDRHHNVFVPGGNWDPFNRAAGTDGSGCVTDMLQACIYGTGMPWRRGGSTESFRPTSMGGTVDPAKGPFGTHMVNDPSEFPADAAVMIGVHHGAVVGTGSHMWCQVDQLKIETRSPEGTVLWDGVNFTTDVVLDVHDKYGNCWWYLPGPILEDGSPIPTAPSEEAH